MMDEILFSLKKIFVTKDSKPLPLTHRILKNLGQLPVEYIQDPKDLIEEIKISRDPVGEGKKHLLITRQKGSYVKPCPCTPHYIGCNYFIINADLNCPLDCSYCILQMYLDNPLLTVHANSEKMWKELDDFLYKCKRRGHFVRIGTGELGDSLALDPITERSTELISYFSARSHALFELKTKTVNISNILKSKPPGNVVIAWSVNSYQMALTEEPGAPKIDSRLDAARMVAQSGYKVAFHFDPLILYQGWEQGYAQVIKELMACIDPNKIAWMSLGSLRFPPALKSVIQKRYPQSKIVCEEFIKGRDGKLRYPKPVRIWLYRRVVELLKKAGGKDIPLYFCMESQDVWLQVLKKTTRGKKEVERLLTLPLEDL
jgi:spore photoproduct lyase